MSYPTQEDELRAKEARAENVEAAEESKFLATFQNIPKKNAQRLTQLARAIVDNFNTVMNDSRQQPYERQEDLMAGMKKLLEEEIRVIEARRVYTTKINPSTAQSAKEEKV
jgi:hypothetical protein